MTIQWCLKCTIPNMNALENLFTDLFTPNPFVESAAFTSEVLTSECWLIPFICWPSVLSRVWPYLSVDVCVDPCKSVLMYSTFFTCITAAACETSSIFSNLCTVQLTSIQKEINMQQPPADRASHACSTIEVVRRTFKRSHHCIYSGGVRVCHTHAPLTWVCNLYTRSI